MSTDLKNIKAQWTNIQSQLVAIEESSEQIAAATTVVRNEIKGHSSALKVRKSTKRKIKQMKKKYRKIGRINRMLCRAVNSGKLLIPSSATI